MSAQPHCPKCKTTIAAPKERLMPDKVVEYRCPSCAYQIPLLPPGPRQRGRCPECGVNPAQEQTASGVDSSGLLNFLFCGDCGCLLGRYWGMIKL